jgi:hypothetical protein
MELVHGVRSWNIYGLAPPIRAEVAQEIIGFRPMTWGRNIQSMRMSTRTHPALIFKEKDLRKPIAPSDELLNKKSLDRYSVDVSNRPLNRVGLPYMRSKKTYSSVAKAHPL